MLRARPALQTSASPWFCSTRRVTFAADDQILKLTLLRERRASFGCVIDKEGEIPKDNTWAHTSVVCRP